ncbi:MAG: GAF domain-containing protein, partial [Anaerolineae bacterium]|nr:GAF domain-containing protein [Anaerolineae bacterium]
MIKVEDIKPRTKIDQWVAQALLVVITTWLVTGGFAFIIALSQFFQPGIAPAGDWLIGGAAWLPSLIVILVAAANLIAAVWLFALRRKHAGGRAAVVFLVSLALVLLGSYGEVSGVWRSPIWLAALPICGASLFDLAQRFPDEHPRLVTKSGITVPVYLVAVALALSSLIFSAPDVSSIARQVLQWASIIFSLVLFIASFAWQYHRHQHQSQAPIRRQLGMLLVGGLASFLPAILWFVAASLAPRSFSFTVAIYLPMLIYPALLVYIIQRYRLVDTDPALHRGIYYGVLLLIISVGYTLLMIGATMLLTNPLGIDRLVVQGIVVFLLVLLLDPLRRNLERTLDCIFFRGSEVYQEGLQTFAAGLMGLADINQVIQSTHTYLQDTIRPVRVHIYLLDRFSDQYRAAAGPDGKATSDLQFPSASPLVAYLAGQRSPVYFYELDQLPNQVRADKGRMMLLAAQVYIPVRTRERMIGWMALGARQSGEPYGKVEMKFLAEVAGQVGQAVERARLVAEMENRVREMNVLTRVAQGINITLTLDDVLELIYAQTSQIIPSDDFRILLASPDPYHLLSIFNVVDGERVGADENRAFAGNELLESEVIREHKPILTDDFEARCQQSGILSVHKGISAWLGVPLIAGSETIGALSMGLRDPTATYQQEQLRLVQAIADQAAGAITKARLLQETERRALQLATLNDVTRQLSSTLETGPLLQSILESAVAILDCEAGSLLMVDEHTDELVFEVIVGPVATDLAGKRIPPGTGIVGQVVENRNPVIVNDVANSPQWFAKTDQQTGFITRALLVVPLLVKEQIIGVIEVINKVNGEPFTLDDQELISAFASQAAVAIENARLYTMTDQALAERVEELSIMQRIDRELNTSLDTANAMQVMVDWAMRKTGAVAGVAGKPSDGMLLVLASAGVDENLQALSGGSLSIDILYGSMDRTAAGAQVEVLARDAVRLSPGACERMIVPIRRELHQMGLLVLESTNDDSFSENDLNFLMRLSDHAAIAISNASLIAEVQAANQAKSEFVSFVSHELKNPMTSIKGYTELIAAGAVGEVNEAQANFL